MVWKKMYFSLIGPKKIDVPWKELEKKSWIAQAHCIEVSVPMRSLMRGMYSVADDREKFRFSSENPEKLARYRCFLHNHKNDQVLIIGQYLDQLQKVSDRFKLPLITGKTPLNERSTFVSNVPE